MSNRAFVFWLVLFAALAAIGVVYTYSAQASTPRKLAPPVPCTSKNRMDMFIDEDNIMWECSCEMLKTGNICRWQVIGGVDEVELRKAIRTRYHLRAVPRLRLVSL